MERRRPLGRREREAPRPGVGDALHQGVDLVIGGHAQARGLGRDLPQLRLEGFRARRIQEHALEEIEVADRRIRQMDRAERGAGLAIVRRALGAVFPEARNQGAGGGIEDLGHQALEALRRRDAEERARLCEIERAAERLAPCRDGRRDLTDVDPGVVGEPVDHRRLPPVGDLVEQPCEDRALHRLVDLDEGGRHSGLQRKTPQDRGAEGVDRLEPQTARGLDCACEERARMIEVERPRHPEVRQSAPQGEVVEHRPFAEAREEAVLHLGRGGLGVGQAQHVLRVHALQQQPRHAVRQDARLARAGIGREPRRGARVGCLSLAEGGVVHPTSSGAAVSLSSHSPKRARWS